MKYISGSIIKHLYKSFLRINGWLLGLIGVGATLTSEWWAPNTATISLNIFIITNSLWLIVLAILIDFSYHAYMQAISPLPKVIASITSENYTRYIGILLLEPSPLLAHESATSIYIKDNNFEILIGIGYVNTIQEDGKIQIAVTKLLDEHNDKKDKLFNNEEAYLSKIIIKPTMPLVFANFGEQQ